MPIMPSHFCPKPSLRRKHFWTHYHTRFARPTYLSTPQASCSSSGTTVKRTALSHSSTTSAEFLIPCHTATMQLLDTATCPKFPLTFNSFCLTILTLEVARYTFFCIKKEHEKKPFLPRLNKATNRLETSIYLVEKYTDDEIWKIGQIFVVELAQSKENESAKIANRTPQQFKLLGRFDFESACLFQQELSLHIETDNIPCEGHSNLLGWDDNPTLGKARNEVIATRLKQHCAKFIALS